MTPPPMTASDPSPVASSLPSAASGSGVTAGAGATISPRALGLPCRLTTVVVGAGPTSWPHSSSARNRPHRRRGASWPHSSSARNRPHRRRGVTPLLLGPKPAASSPGRLMTHSPRPETAAPSPGRLMTGSPTHGSPARTRRDRGDLAEFADAALAGGVDIIQLRDKPRGPLGPLEGACAELKVRGARRRRAGGTAPCWPSTTSPPQPD